MSRSIQKTKRLHRCKVTMGEIYTFGELIKQQLTISKGEEQLNGFIYTKLYLNGWEKISSVLPERGTRKKRKKPYLVWRPLATVLDIFSTKQNSCTFPKLNENEKLNIFTAYN